MLALWLVGCEKETTPTTDPDPTDPPTTESTGAARTGALGSIALVEYTADAYYADAETVGVGLFVSSDPGVDNLAECVLLGAPCLDGPAVAGAPPAVVPVPEGLEPLDAGPQIRVGPAWLQHETADVGRVYLGDGFTLGTDHRLAFDGDLVRFSSDDAFDVPDPLADLSPDPSETIVLGAGDDLDLGWAPGSVGDVALRWPGAAVVQVRPVADEGSARLTAAELGLRPPLDATWVTLSRTVHAALDANGNDVRMTIGREQWYYLDLVATDGWTDLAGSASIGEACGDAATPLPDGQWFGSLAAAANDHDLGAGNPLTGYATAGRDLSFPVDLGDGDTLELAMRQVWLDAAIYVFSDGCTVVEAAADATIDHQEEVLVFVAPAAGRYHVVLDGYGEDQGERFSLTTRTIRAK